jgi:hypothetical protein
MTKTAAISAARSSVILYRQGSGWICEWQWRVSHLDLPCGWDVNAFSLAGEQPYQFASYAAQAIKLSVALRLRERSKTERELAVLIDTIIANRRPGERWESLVR